MTPLAPCEPHAEAPLLRGMGANAERPFADAPAKAGVQRLSKTLAVESLDSRVRGDDTAQRQATPGLSRAI